MAAYRVGIQPNNEASAHAYNAKARGYKVK